MGVVLTDQGEIEAPQRALIVVAHPDDIDFGMAGTVAALTGAGCHVAYCLATSGEAGGDDLAHTPAELAEMRQAEQTAAAKRVGVTELHWLGHPDGMVVADLGLRRDIARVIRMSRPEVVLCQTTIPNWDHIYISHPDHLATATAALAAVYPDSRNPRAFPELLDEGHEPHEVSEIWLTGTEPNRYIDITDTFSQKIAALREHHSQVAQFDGLDDRVREWCGATAEAGGLAQGRLAEAYRVVPAGCASRAGTRARDTRAKRASEWGLIPMPKRCVYWTCFLTFADMDQQLHRHSRDRIARDSATTLAAARKGGTSGDVASVFRAVRWTFAVTVLLAGVLSGLLFPVAAGAHAPSPPANSSCERTAVVAKLSVVEDRAAANMLAEAIRALDLGGRCLVDAGNPATGVSPSSGAREAVATASSVYVVGGPTAIPDEWMRDQFGVHSPTRVHGCDRWATQEATVRAVLALTRGTDVSSSMLCGSGTGELPPNLNCGLGAVLAKLSVTEDRAAANMLAEARRLTSADGDARCLIDAGDPGSGVPPTQAAKAEAQRARLGWVVGGAEALPDEWLARHFGNTGTTRIWGGDRWATQSAAVQEIVRLAQNSDGPDGESSGSASGALVEESSAGTGQFAIDDVTVEVHMCAAPGAFDEGDLAREVKLLNDNVVPWFESQFGNSGASIRFAAGAVLDITAEAWKSENFEFLYNAERDPSSHSCEKDSLRRYLPGYTLRSQWKRALIITDIPVLRTGTHGYAYRPTGPAWVAHRERLPDWPYRFERDKYYFAAVAHELGHSVYGLEHVWKGWNPQPAEDCPSIRRAASGDAVRQHELESLMAWAPCSGIYDLSDGKGAFLLCRQRQELGWTEPSECNSSGITVAAPGAPALTRVVPGDGSLRLEWNAPTGPARVTDYDVIYRPVGASGWTEWRPEEISTRPSATITGLTNGQRYEVLVWAHNDSAVGPNSRSLFGTPRAPEPDDTNQPEPQRAIVTVSAGADARPSGQCSSIHCRWLRIDAGGLGSGPFTVECWHEQFRNFPRAAFGRTTVSNLPTENVCFFGFPGVKVWAVVNGVKSNELTWPR